MIRLILIPLWILHGLPLRLIAALGAGLGWLVYRLARERRRVTLINLGLCFPQWSQPRREQVALAHFQGFVSSALSMGVGWFAPLSRLDRLIRIEGKEYLEQARQRGPVILITPHFFGVDTVGPYLFAHYDMITINSQQKDAALEALIRTKRLRWGRGQIFTRQDNLRAVLRALKPGWMLYYLPDQDFGPKDSLFVDFFGVKAATVPALSRVARLARATVVPCVVHQDFDKGGWRAEFLHPWEDFPTSDEAADTRRMNQLIETCILDQPANYLWSHKRFKTRPPGEPSYYDRVK